MSRWRATIVLAVVLSLTPPVTAADAGAPDGAAPDIATLRKDLELAVAGKDAPRALALAEEILALREQDRAGAMVEIAALHLRFGDKENAYARLAEALETGWVDVLKLREDPAFESIRGEERFRIMVRKAWAKQYIAMLERPERESFQKPRQVLAALALRPGERVADVGAGSGYFTLPVARAVCPAGVVWAIDIRQEMLDHIAQRLAEEKIDNVKLQLVQPDDPQLPAGGVDTILMVDTFHYIKDGAAYARKLRDGLAPGGRVVVIDYTPKPWGERPWGPLPEQQLAREQLDEFMAAAGLKPAKVHDFLTEQYFVEYRTADEPAARQ